MTDENQDRGPDDEPSSGALPVAASGSGVAGQTSAPRRFPIWLALLLGVMVVIQVALVVAVLRTSDDVAAVREDVAALSATSTAPTAGPESTSQALPAVEGEEPGSGDSTGDDPGVDSVPTGFTDEGYPYRGSPDARVTLIEYSDYGCPFCGRYTAETIPTLMTDYVALGDVRIVFRDFPLVALHPTAPAAHTAAWCAGEQGAGFYWAMHDAIFARQADWTSLADPADFLAGLAAAEGVDTAAYDNCVVAGDPADRISEGLAEARALGFNGTPSFVFVAADSGEEHVLVGAQPVATFQGYLDAILAGRQPPQPAAAPPPGATPQSTGLPAWADRDTGLQPDPERPGVTLAGDQYRGNPDASVVVIEFSDFECPFCRQHALASQPAIDEELVDTGQVLWVFKHLPLEIHAGALSAAIAAECAGDQNQFWAMHDLLFATAERWTAEDADTDAELLLLGDELGLDAETFAACFDGRDALQRVLADTRDAAGIISSTPSFVLVRAGRGSLLEGALPSDQFIDSLKAMLAEEA